MDYKDLYTQAWNAWTFYWKEGGISATFVVETAVIDNLHEARVTTHVRKQVLVHKFTGETHDLMWQRGVSELLKAGAAKIYESIMELARDKHQEIQSNPRFLYPLLPSDYTKTI